MLGIYPKGVCHRLNVNNRAKLVGHKPMRLAPDHINKVHEEVNHLLATWFIKKLEYSIRVSNTVVVPKPKSKIKVCLDFTNHNKACHMYPYPLPRISNMVDATT